MQTDPKPARRQTERLDPGRAAALAAALDRPALPGPEPLLPPFFHHVCFWDAQPPGSLGRDGHPRLGSGLIPDLGLPRRMWAGGDLIFHRALRAGREATRVTTLQDVTRKTGRSGRLAFVTLRHRILQDGALSVTEDQHLVYRQDPHGGPPPTEPVMARDDAMETRRLRIDTTLLFRYSALTFNGHRIHYDLDYARRVEGYAGLVVHGPLLAQLLMLMAEDAAPLARFGFRAVSPLIQGEQATLCRNGAEFWVRGADGRVVMTARRDA